MDHPARHEGCECRPLVCMNAVAASRTASACTEGARQADPSSFTRPVGGVYRGMFSSSCVPDVYHELLQLAKPLMDGGERASRPISRVLSPPLCSRPLRAAAPRRRGTAIHLRRRLPGACSGPTRDMGRATLDGEPSVPVRPCSGRGLPGRPVTRPPVGSYPTISPLPQRTPRLCHFCGTLLRVTPTGRYPAPCSVEPGLSSDDERPRPSGRLARRFYRRAGVIAVPHHSPRAVWCGGQRVRALAVRSHGAHLFALTRRVETATVPPVSGAQW